MPTSSACALSQAGHCCSLRCTCQLPDFVRQLPREVCGEEAEPAQLPQVAPLRPHRPAQLPVAASQHQVSQAAVVQELQGVHERGAAEVA